MNDLLGNNEWNRIKYALAGKEDDCGRGGEDIALRIHFCTLCCA
jgi:hypothetical protein